MECPEEETQRRYGGPQNDEDAEVVHIQNSYNNITIFSNKGSKLNESARRPKSVNAWKKLDE